MPRPCGADLRRLRADVAEVELLSHGAARACAQGLVWPSDTDHTRRRTLLPATHRRPLPIHVGAGSRQQGRDADAIRCTPATKAECVRKLRTDNVGEFIETEFASYCVDEGIQRHYSAPYSPQ
jgi:hypothetical protein